VIGCIYRPPCQPIDGFINGFDNSLLEIDASSEKVILGDFNVDLTSGKANANLLLKRKLQGLTNSHDLKQVICSPTRITDRSSSLIDLRFTNTPHKIVEVGVVNLSLSDHSIVYCVFKSGLVRVHSLESLNLDILRIMTSNILLKILNRYRGISP
jgi:hypothetical protein